MTQNFIKISKATREFAEKHQIEPRPGYTKKQMLREVVQTSIDRFRATKYN